MADRRVFNSARVMLFFFSPKGNLQWSTNAIANVSYFIITSGDKWRKITSDVFQEPAGSCSYEREDTEKTQFFILILYTR